LAFQPVLATVVAIGVVLPQGLLNYAGEDA
jgi:hypothetical protein